MAELLLGITSKVVARHTRGGKQVAIGGRSGRYSRGLHVCWTNWNYSRNIHMYAVLKTGRTGHVAVSSSRSHAIRESILMLCSITALVPADSRNITTLSQVANTKFIDRRVEPAREVEWSYQSPHGTGIHPKARGSRVTSLSSGAASGLSEHMASPWKKHSTGKGTVHCISGAKPSPREHPSGHRDISLILNAYSSRSRSTTEERLGRFLPYRHGDTVIERVRANPLGHDSLMRKTAPPTVMSPSMARSSTFVTGKVNRRKERKKIRGSTIAGFSDSILYGST